MKVLSEAGVDEVGLSDWPVVANGHSLIFPNVEFIELLAAGLGSGLSKQDRSHSLGLTFRLSRRRPCLMNAPAPY